MPEHGTQYLYRFRVPGLVWLVWQLSPEVEEAARRRPAIRDRAAPTGRQAVSNLPAIRAELSLERVTLSSDSCTSRKRRTPIIPSPNSVSATGHGRT